MNPNTTQPDPGEGYDLITPENAKEFEPRLDTDECLNDVKWEIVPFKSIPFSPYNFYRRRKPTPETKVIDGVKYQRVLEKTGLVQDGDFIQWPGNFERAYGAIGGSLEAWNTGNTKVWRPVPQGENKLFTYDLLHAMERDQLRAELAATKKELANYKEAADSYARQIREMNGVKG